MKYEVDQNGDGMRIGVLASRWYPELMARLVEPALNALERSGVAPEAIDIARVPGSFELPAAASKMIETGRYDAIVCLGIVIRGETSHYDYVAGESARGIAELAIRTGTPVLNGVLTCENRRQVEARAGGGKGDKGAEVAIAAIEMVNLYRQMEGR